MSPPKCPHVSLPQCHRDMGGGGLTPYFSLISLMKDSQKMVSRCIYLNILLQTRAQDILAK